MADYKKYAKKVQKKYKYIFFNENIKKKQKTGVK